MNQGGRGAAGYGGNQNGGESPSRLQAMHSRGAEMVEGARERIYSGTDLAKKKAREVAADRTTRVVAASGVGGAVVVGAGGAGAGLLTGGAIGGAIGFLPALFTFGLSIPIGVVIGGTCGTVVGAATGGTAGATGGSAIGYVAYKKRADIRTSYINANLRFGQQINRTKNKIQYYYDMARTKVVETNSFVKEKVTRTWRDAKANFGRLTRDNDVQHAAAYGAAGAVALGTGGGFAGVISGGAVGAAVGLVPALFTFGLSIPFCAVIGGGCGGAIGTAVGGTAGGVVGVSGYAAYTRRAAIAQAIRSTIKKAGKSVNSVAEQAGLSKYAREVQESARDLSDKVQNQLSGSRNGSSRNGDSPDRSSRDRSASPYGC